MNFSQRIKFYAIGIFFGIFLVYLLFGDRKMSCTYFPNARVLEECYNKPKKYSALSIKQLREMGLDYTFIQQKVFTTSKIDFSKSIPRKKPCGLYFTKYPKKKPLYEIVFQKCSDKIIISSINKLK
ncbi:MAG: hypothetical protein ACEQSF_04825 [Solirubrobacteraceae bacterium]